MTETDGAKAPTAGAPDDRPLGLVAHLASEGRMLINRVEFQKRLADYYVSKGEPETAAMIQAGWAWDLLCRLGLLPTLD